MVSAATPTDVFPSITQSTETKPAQGLGIMLPLYASFATLDRKSVV